MTELLLQKIEKVTEEGLKHRLAKELEFSRFVDKLYQDRACLLEKLKEAVYERCDKFGAYTPPLDVLANRLQSIFKQSGGLPSDSRAEIERQVLEVIGQIVVLVWVEQASEQIKMRMH